MKDLQLEEKLETQLDLVTQELEHKKIKVQRWNPHFPSKDLGITLHCYFDSSSNQIEGIEIEYLGDKTYSSLETYSRKCLDEDLSRYRNSNPSLKIIGLE